mmetsp:Transcript_83089/g.199426  ORF Transcript_83089/g.199426 Transcript_83089/m.199426 type:complete len:265 (-) Transcript_83089:23-817(-)
MAHTYPAREMSHLRRREPPGASLPQIQRHSGGGSDHLLRELLCLVFSVELLNDLQRKLQRGAWALAGDDISIDHCPGVLPLVAHQLLELGCWVGGGALLEQAVVGKDHRGARAHRSRQTPAALLLLQHRLKFLAVSEVLRTRHAPGQRDHVVLPDAVPDVLVCQDLEATRHTHFQVPTAAGHSDLGPCAREHIGDAGRLNLLRVCGDGHQHSVSVGLGASPPRHTVSSQGRRGRPSETQRQLSEKHRQRRTPGSAHHGAGHEPS